MVTIPERLAARLASEPDAGREWLAALPDTVSRLEAAWHLHLGNPIEPGGMTSIVFPAQRAATASRPDHGPDAVLKVPVPDAEVAAEPAGLALVEGNGAVRLFDHDPASGALLLEAADPDRSLLDLGDADHAATVAAEVLRRWWRPVPPTEAGAAVSSTAPSTIPALVDAGPLLAANLRRRQHALGAMLAASAIDASLLDRAIATFAAPDPTADTLLHTDLHQGNVLAARREPWLIIDPKPLVGEAAYDLEPLLRDHRGGPPSDVAIRRRFDATSAQLGLDRDRARDWVVARSVELGLWSLEAGEDTLGNQQLRVAAVLVNPPARGR